MRPENKYRPHDSRSPVPFSDNPRLFALPVNASGNTWPVSPGCCHRPRLRPTQRGSCLKTARLDPRRGWTSSEALAARGWPRRKACSWRAAPARKLAVRPLSRDAAAARMGGAPAPIPPVKRYFPPTRWRRSTSVNRPFGPAGLSHGASPAADSLGHERREFGARITPY